MRADGLADDGVATAVEMMYLLVFCLVAIVFLGFVGRLHAAGVEVTNAAQSAARAASQAPSLAAAQQAADWVVEHSGLAARCDGGGHTTVGWVPSPSGTWQGGTVTVEVECSVTNTSLTGLWSPGKRTVIMRDTQPIDRYHR
jgi:Flp pilus assembly protein TadG